MTTKKKIIIGLSIVAVITIGVIIYKKSSNKIDPKLDWIQSKNVASYLSKKLTPIQMGELRGWVSTIKSERAKDPKKWGASSGLAGQLSDIGHALYQMKLWNSEDLAVLKQG